jgi:hypothetical protein
VARIQKHQVLLACVVGRRMSSQGVSVIFDMGLSLDRMTNMIWHTLHHQQTLTTMTRSALQLGSPFAQY